MLPLRKTTVNLYEVGFAEETNYFLIYNTSNIILLFTLQIIQQLTNQFPLKNSCVLEHCTFRSCYRDENSPLWHHKLYPLGACRAAYATGWDEFYPSPNHHDFTKRCHFGMMRYFRVCIKVMPDSDSIWLKFTNITDLVHVVSPVFV